MGWAKRLVYGFCELPHVKQLSIARDLGLYQAGDEELLAPALLLAMHERSVEAGKWPDVRARIEEELRRPPMAGRPRSDRFYEVRDRLRKGKRE